MFAWLACEIQIIMLFWTKIQMRLHKVHFTSEISVEVLLTTKSNEISK